MIDVIVDVRMTSRDVIVDIGMTMTSLPVYGHTEWYTSLLVATGSHWTRLTSRL